MSRLTIMTIWNSFIKTKYQNNFFVTEIVNFKVFKIKMAQISFIFEVTSKLFVQKSEWME